MAEVEQREEVAPASVPCHRDILQTAPRKGEAGGAARGADDAQVQPKRFVGSARRNKSVGQFGTGRQQRLGSGSGPTSSGCAQARFPRWPPGCTCRVQHYVQLHADHARRIELETFPIADAQLANVTVTAASCHPADY